MKTDIETHSKQTYTLLSELGFIEEQEVLQYGIQQDYIDNNGVHIKTGIHYISDEEKLVMDLLKRLENQDVAPFTLQYIVEDYLDEIYSL